MQEYIEMVQLLKLSDWTDDEYVIVQQHTKNVKDVYTYGGFWIGRYGIEGTTTETTSTSSSENIIETKK